MLLFTLEAQMRFILVLGVLVSPIPREGSLASCVSGKHPWVCEGSQLCAEADTKWGRTWLLVGLLGVWGEIFQ